MVKRQMEVLYQFAPGLLAALFYGVVSGSMSFLNKMVLTTYSFNFPDVVMLMQVVMTSVILEVCRKFDVCDIPEWTVQRGKEFAVPSFCFALHTTLALAALEDLSIPMYNVLRRMLPLAILLMSSFVLLKTPSRGIIMSVSLIVAGTLCAGLGDLRFHLVGYLDALSSVIAQATYLTYVQKTGLEKGVSAVSVLHLNSINCIPLMFSYSLMNGSLAKALHFRFNEPSVVGSIVINTTMGCVLNYSLFLCATMNSALTTSFVGVIKGIITTIVGFFTFGGVPITALTVTGVTLNSMGGVVYVYVRYNEKQSQLKEFISKPDSNKLENGTIIPSADKEDSPHYRNVHSDDRVTEFIYPQSVR